MKFKIIFINPNTVKEVDQYLPKILAEAVIHNIVRQQHKIDIGDCCQGKCPA